MPISIGELFGIAAPAALNALRRPYRLGTVNILADGVIRHTSLYHPESGHGVDITWTTYDERRLHNNERQTIDFVRMLLDTAITALDRVLAEGRHLHQWRPIEPPPMDDVVDVNFD
jgi:hypothetical protein